MDLDLYKVYTLEELASRGVNTSVLETRANGSDHRRYIGALVLNKLLRSNGAELNGSGEYVNATRFCEIAGLDMTDLFETEGLLEEVNFGESKDYGIRIAKLHELGLDESKITSETTPIYNQVPEEIKPIEKSSGTKKRSEVNNNGDSEIEEVEGIPSTELGLYIGDVRKHPRLSRERELELAYQLRTLEKGSRNYNSAREEFISGNLRLVISTAKIYQGRGLDLPDLVQHGNIGLMTAAEKFDPERRYKFSTYATYWIRQAIGRAINEEGRTIRIPSYIPEELSKIREAYQKLFAQGVQDPTNEELVEKSGVSLKGIRRAKKGLPETVSIDSAEDEDRNVIMINLEYKGAETDDESKTKMLKEAIKKALKKLPSDEAKAINLGFGLSDGRPRTQKEVAEILGTTRATVMGLQTRGIQKLKDGPASGILEDFLE